MSAPLFFLFLWVSAAMFAEGRVSEGHLPVTSVAAVKTGGVVIATFEKWAELRECSII